MILKKMKQRCFKKGKAVMIGGLVDYILQLTDERGNDKLAYYGAKNFITETPKGQKAEMNALASESLRSPMPVTHWIMSWQENELPSHEQIDEAVDVFLERMGLEGHQVMYALHNNSAHHHVHIIVNRTNPDTLKVIQPHRGFDIEEAHRIVAWLVHTQRWAAEKNARYCVNQDGEIVRNRGWQEMLKPRSGATDFEHATGEKSAQRIAQEKGHGIIQSAKSWAELHERLEKVGLRFEKKGSGAVVFVGDIAVKSSSIDRNFGLSKLCKRLGDFEEGQYAPEMKTPKPEPASTVALKKWREYREQREQEKKERRERKRRASAVIAKTRAAHRKHRQSVVASLSRHGLSILNIARHFLKVQQREELQRLREDLPKPPKPMPRFMRWLAAQDEWTAKFWKYRNRISSGMDVQKFQFPKIGNMASPYLAYREAIQKKYPEKPDTSRVDAMIALWMRCAGYTRQEVANEIHRKARPTRKEGRDWDDYINRTVWYAFGAAGDIDIAAFKPRPEKILAFHQEAEKLEAARLGEVRQEEVEREAPRLRMR
jgi:hypothetical protein